MRRKIAGLAVLPFVFGMTVMAAPSASADAIDCPDQKTTVNPSTGGWDCKNRGGNLDNSEDTKNPNTKKFHDPK